MSQPRTTALSDPARVPLTQLARTASARPVLARIVQAAAPARVRVAAFNSSV
ncbi:FxSxx-COOH cyclophane-containing RiPP peptide [Streptomyces sp. NPDC002952]|uniref:FxSxx-COOH cyclophane-containing RiPP peptide n=1 Tax=Streptomyces sp. NPDC002952 TaxID=3364673 RepID=UPI0036806A66